MQDVRMRNFDFSKYRSLTSCVIEICKVGDAKEKGALADSFDFQSMLSVPEFKKSKNIDEAIKWLEAQIAELAIFYGTQITGDIEYLAYQLFNDFGGLSVLDFIKFFAMCKKREFVTDYEHVKVQGINPDFIIKWISKYEEKRFNATDALVRDANGNIESRSHLMLNAAQAISHIDVANEIKDLERRANELRKEFVASLHDKRTFEYEIGDEIIPIQSEYISEKKAGLFLYDFVLNFIAFEQKKATSIVKYLSEAMTQTYNESSEESLNYLREQGVTLSEYKRQQAIQFVLSGKKKLVLMPILEGGVDEKTEVFKKSGFNNVKPFIQALIKAFESDYLTYLKSNIEKNNPPLEIQEYLIQRALYFLKENGLNRPFSQYDSF